MVECKNDQNDEIYVISSIGRSYILVVVKFHFKMPVIQYFPLSKL